MLFIQTIWIIQTIMLDKEEGHHLVWPRSKTCDFHIVLPSKGKRGRPVKMDHEMFDLSTSNKVGLIDVSLRN